METTQDAFLGGDLIIQQPKIGYRAGQDPVLLAAAIPIQLGQSFIDIGCGAGTVSLCLARRVSSDLVGFGIDLDADLIGLANTNAHQNGFKNLDFTQADLFTTSPTLLYDWALSNPPFFSAHAGRQSPDPSRRRGRHSAHSLTAWLKCVRAWIRPRGHIGLILHTHQILEALGALQPEFGGITLMPVLGNSAKGQADRCLLFARQGSKSPLTLMRGFTVRNDQGTLTDGAQRVLRDGEALCLPRLK